MQQRVLLVHNDSSVREQSTRALSRIGVEIDILPRGADALLALDARRYSVVVVDRELSDDFFEGVADRTDKPIVICTTSEKNTRNLDTTVVNLLVPQPYAASTVVGVILACVNEKPLPRETAATDRDQARGETQS